ncbi:MAG TPA: hypothetical protein VK861_11235, partial [Bacteroidales bacterium]|nr:hypothetical protein [Bacteroidales bacterium]
MKRVLLLSIVVVTGGLLICSCNQTAKNKGAVRKEVFGTHQGKEVHLLTLTNKEGNVIRLTN